MNRYIFLIGLLLSGQSGADCYVAGEPVGFQGEQVVFELEFGDDCPKQYNAWFAVLYSLENTEGEPEENCLVNKERKPAGKGLQVRRIAIDIAADSRPPYALKHMRTKQEAEQYCSTVNQR
ncbi:MAG: hypothetical protein AB1Z51_11325 [Desulfuromonadales bacterium]